MGVIRRTSLQAGFRVGLLAVVLIFFGALPAAAHSTFSGSNPAGGSVIDRPVDEITMVFNQRVQPVGDGFRLIEEDGTVRVPSDESTTDGGTWVIRFDPPVAAGVAEVQWSIRSVDSHVLTGSFQFTVEATETVDSTVPAEAATEPLPDEDAAAPAPDADQSGVAAGSAETADGTDAVDAGAEPAVEEDAGAPEAQTDVARAAAAAPENAAIEDDPASPSEAESPGVLPTAVMLEPGTVGFIGRLASTGGSLVALGALVFLLHLLQGTVAEGVFVSSVVRRAAVVVAGGAVLELAAQAALEAGRWSGVLTPGVLASALSTSFGASIGLKLIGAFGLMSSDHFRREPIGLGTTELIRSNMERSGLLAAAPGPPAGPFAVTANGPGPTLATPLFRWQPSSGGSAAVLGGFALLSSAAVDGHTLSGGYRLLAGLVTAVHVLAGGVWLGGIIVLLVLLTGRFRSHRHLEAADLAVRFSSLAAGALVLVGLAGSALTFTTLDALPDLWSTPWGRLVLAKLALVAVAGFLGAVNHFSVVPRLAEASDNQRLGTMIKRLVSVEIALLLTVVIVTTQLVATSS